MILWRLSAARFAATAFSGEGARLYGGRWSPAGLPVAYCAESRSLALVEVLAGTDDPARLFGQKWVLLSAEVPEDCVEKPARVPDNWRRFPYTPDTQAFGAEWMRSNRSVALRVPSAVVPGELNFLLNPAHPDFKRVKIEKPEPFDFDPRLA
ncbi:MAG TPA: RES family NAD+ phosphorylase [Opitutaceae bacterium]|nr:RES family NAD+ phosphorylase [Opitutaceae bacterium]